MSNESQLLIAELNDLRRRVTALELLETHGNANIVTNATIGADIAATLVAATAKATPVDADTVPLIDSADSNALKKLSWANIKATLKTYFDTLYTAINTAVLLTGTQTIAGSKTFTSAVTVEAAGQVVNATRVATSTNQLSAAAGFKAKLVGTMADGFGTGFFFRGEDSDAVENNFVLIGGVRDGADNSGTFRVFVYKAGVAQQYLDLDSDGNLDHATTTGAWRVPRLTTTQRDALTAADGMVIFNTSLVKLQVYAGGWVSVH